MDSLQSTSRYTSKHGSCPYLGEDNYSEWRVHMRVMLRGISTFEIVEGSEHKPPAPSLTTRSAADRYTDSERKDYFKRRGLAAMLIWNSLKAPAQSLVVRENDDPQAMWNTLRERLDVTMNDVSALRIRRQFNIEKYKENDSLTTWYGRLIDYQHRLIGSEWEISNNDIIMTLLEGLPENWRNIKEQVINTRPRMSLVLLHA